MKRVAVVSLAVFFSLALSQLGPVVGTTHQAGMAYAADEPNGDNNQTGTDEPDGANNQVCDVDEIC